VYGQEKRVTGGGMKENEIAEIIVEASFKIHRALGPGLFESVYESLLDYELKKDELKVNRQAIIPIVYNGIRFDEGFRADLIVNDLVIVELKSVEKVMPVHKKQLLTYLKLSGSKLGLLINFGEDLLKHGITRIANGI